jgi:hypothetical protein
MNVLSNRGIKVGDLVFNRHQPHKRGIVKTVESGCNGCYWVDCGYEFLTIMGGNDARIDLTQ